MFYYSVHYLNSIKVNHIFKCVFLGVNIINNNINNRVRVSIYCILGIVNDKTNLFQRYIL